MSAPQYRSQVALSVRLLPLLTSELEFALKGAIAINLFWRELPRLSVDLDLTYPPLADRATWLGAIEAALRRLAGLIRGIYAPLTAADRTILQSVKTGQPDWPQAGLPQASTPPAVQWRLANFARLKDARRAALADRLKAILEL